MRDAPRTLAAAAPAGVVIAAAWLRFEQPLGSLWRAAAIVALALVVAALPGWKLRVVAGVVAALVVARLSFGVWLLQLHPHLGRVGSQFGNGFLDSYSTHLPFDPRVHVDMAEVVLVAVFCFALLVALLVAARKPVLAALALLAGAGWPSTLLGPSYGLAMGAAILVAGLALLLILGSRRPPVVVVPVAVVVVVAAVAVGSATAARHGALRWQAWNPARSNAPTSVAFVWKSQYDGLHWPKTTTTVLDVESDSLPNYLRAGVLDDFNGDRWRFGKPRPADALEPAAARNPAHETRETVTVQGLKDSLLIGGSIPVRFAAGSAPIVQRQPGLASVPRGLARGFHYRVWSYAPNPSPAALARARPAYPRVLVRGGMLDVGFGVSLPAFGTPHRNRIVAAKLTHSPTLYRYLPLERIAVEKTRGARTPYAAVIDLERWFVVGGGFRYSDHPFVVAPALVGFVTQTRSGYCQFFAGAMALMLRYLGIPARVAVGFAGSNYAQSGSWAVSDRDAHAWVEVWFRGYGWLPFDPTPSVSFSTRAALFTSGHDTAESVSSPGIFARRGARDRRVGSPRPGVHRSPHGRAGFARRIVVPVVLLLVLGALAGIVAVKRGLILIRRLERDPRRVAAACRDELVRFLLDQRIESAASATARELGELTRRELGADGAAFAAAATAARFGPAGAALGAARASREELRALLRACRRSLTRRERLAGLLSLRSLARPRAAGEWPASLGAPVESTGS